MNMNYSIVNGYVQNECIFLTGSPLLWTILSDLTCLLDDALSEFHRQNRKSNGPDTRLSGLVSGRPDIRLFGRGTGRDGGRGRGGRDSGLGAALGGG